MGSTLEMGCFVLKWDYQANGEIWIAPLTPFTFSLPDDVIAVPYLHNKPLELKR